MAINRHQRKAHAVIETAEILVREPHYWDELQSMPTDEALECVRRLPRIGAKTGPHLVRNLGWDVAHQGGFSEKVSTALGTTTDELIQRLAKVTGLRVRTTDLLLGDWAFSHDSQDADDAVEEFVALLRSGSFLSRVKWPWKTG